MKAGMRLGRFLETMSITTRFGLGVALLLALFATVAATSYLAMAFVRRAQESIQTSTEIQRLVLEMDRGMEKAHRLNGDFLLRYSEIGLQKAHELYAQPAIRQIAQVVSASAALKQLIAQSEVSEPLKKTQVDVNLFLSSAGRFAEKAIESVELVTALAAPESGLHAQMEREFTDLEEQTRHHEGLARLVAEMKSYAQGYRIGRKRHLMQSAFNTISSLRQELDQSPVVGPVQSQEIHELLDRFLATAQRILDVDVALKANFNDFALQEAAVDAVSKTLVQVASGEVRRTQDRIRQAERLAMAVLASITLAGLVAALLIARMLNQRITRRVVGLTAAAEALREGHLEVCAGEEGGDELSRLARTFNLMAARIRELVAHLEGKVEERTRELSVNERRFRQLFEHSSSAVAILEAVADGEDFVFKDINRAAEAIDKLRRGEVIGKTVTEVFPAIAAFGLLDVLRRVWRTGRSADHPVSYYADERVQGWRKYAVYPLPSGEIVTVGDDLSASKQAESERQAMESRLQRAQKMESIGLLAGGVAHDLNNILAGIVGYPELLLMQLPADSRLRKPIMAMHESGLRVAAVVADLLTVARGVACAKEPASLNRLIEEYLDSPEHAKLSNMHAAIACIPRLEANLPPILCSPVHIKKCIMNLVTNAMEAIEGSGRIELATRLGTVSEPAAAAQGIRPGVYALLSVADNGKGIPEKDLEHIFEPFYTRKVMGISGTGLGLAVVWNSVQDHGGTIQVASGPGGTTFTVYLPVSEDAAKPKTENGTIEDWRGNGETVLVVDDEALQRDLASGMLTALGCQPVCVASGEAAVSYLQENQVEVLLLDMVMAPGINGRETYERILQMRPGQRAIIASGFSENEEVQVTLQLGARKFIRKPYCLEDLAQALKEALQG